MWEGIDDGRADEQMDHAGCLSGKRVYLCTFHREKAGQPQKDGSDGAAADAFFRVAEPCLCVCGQPGGAGDKDGRLFAAGPYEPCRKEDLLVRRVLLCGMGFLLLAADV